MSDDPTVALIASFLEEKIQLEFQKTPLNLTETRRRAETSQNGHKLDELLSALQKYCRRGKLLKAFYICVEFESFCKLPTGNAIYTNFINRLRVILLEEVSIANPDAIIKFNQFYEIVEASRAPTLSNQFYEIVETSRAPTLTDYARGERDSETLKYKRLMVSMILNKINEKKHYFF